MRFGPDIIDRILKELEKVPNIRYVCSKVGIDHSTFYRWLMRYPSFNKRVTMAIFLGKRAISGTAETVIIKGVQNGDYRSATFWLSHNDPQYMQRDKGRHHGDLLEMQTKMLKKPIKYDGSNFESLFQVLYEFEKSFGVDTESNRTAKKVFIDLFCDDDKELIELCHASYEDWRINKMNEEAKEEMLKEDP